AAVLRSGGHEANPAHQAGPDRHALVVLPEILGVLSATRRGEYLDGLVLQGGASLVEPVPEADRDQPRDARQEDAQQRERSLAAQVLPGPPPLAQVLEVALHLKRVRRIGSHLRERFADRLRDQFPQFIAGHVSEAHAQASPSSSPAASAIA